MHKIVAISDLHGLVLPSIPECDLLIIAGDICPDFSWRDGNKIDKQLTWFKNTFRPWLDAQPARKVVMIWGNHDFCGEVMVGAEFDKATLLTDDLLEWEGLRIYGTPWTFVSGGWAFDNLINERNAMQGIPECDILVTHAPPYGLMDIVPGAGHCGSVALRARLCEIATPKLHVFGHIHEGMGSVPGSINAARVDGNYDPYSGPVAVVTLEAPETPLDTPEKSE